MSIRFDSSNNNTNILPSIDNPNNSETSTINNKNIDNNNEPKAEELPISSEQKESTSESSKLVFINDRNSFSDFRALQIRNKLDGGASGLLALNSQKPRQSPTTATTKNTPPPSPSPSASALDTTVKEKGVNISSSSKSDPQAVKELQNLINKHTGDKLEVNGNFDNKTQAAVRAFQREASLPVTGIVDSKTLETLQTGKQQISDYYLHTRYTPSDLTSLYDKGDPKGVYSSKDDLVNYVAEGEGGFNAAEDLGDGGGLSVGILQWTQNAGRLGEVTSKYKEVATQSADKRASQQVKDEIANKKLLPELADKRKAELSDQYNEFYSSFGGKQAANELLRTLQNNPKSISSSSIAKKFEQAGNKPIFQKAQRELALSAISERYLPKIAPASPYAKDGTLSKQTIALSLAVNNISESATSRLNNIIVKEKYTELVTKNPKIEEDINKKLNSLTPAQVRETYSKVVPSNSKSNDEVQKQLTQFESSYDKTHSTKKLTPEQLQKAKQERQTAIEGKESQLKSAAIKEELKRDVVTQNVSEEEFNRRFIDLAPSTLYSPANERKFGNGLKNRLNRLSDSASSQEQINLR